MRQPNVPGAALFRVRRRWLDRTGQQPHCWTIEPASFWQRWSWPPPLLVQSPRVPTCHAEPAGTFYAECLKLLNESGLPLLVGGTFAVSAHTGLSRPVKDIDVFCKAGDYPRILAYFRERGYARHLAKAGGRPYALIEV